MKRTPANRPDQRPDRADERLPAARRLETGRPIISAPCTPHRATGFTLIEMMVATAVTAVLSSVAYPSFQSQIQKARRADAMLAIHQVQMAQERWRANHGGYATLADLRLASASPSGHYTIDVASIGLHNYEIRAQATGTQALDTVCGQLRLTVDGATMRHSSGADASSTNPAAQNRQCWSL
jgi:type IV pilus assembly protein PilE